MYNMLAKVFVILSAVLTMIIWPLLDMTAKFDTVSQNYAMSKVSRFIDASCNGGYINEDMMQVLTKQLSATGNAYTIEITHEHKVYMPVYEEDMFSGETVIVYENTYEDEILEEIYNGDGEYTMSEGDYLSVVVKSSSRTLNQRISGMLGMGENTSPAINVSDGGRVRDDLH